MLRTRVIPSLLLKNGGLVKTIRFKDPKYVGDPINAIKIFNDKEVDELVVIDIDASKKQVEPNYTMLDRINKEAFMPLGYGGGIRTMEQIRRILGLGYEKVIINSSALADTHFIESAAAICGSQSIVVCIDSKNDFFGNPKVYDHKTSKTTKYSLREYACLIESFGAGEIILYSVDRDGTYLGYDIKALHEVSSAVTIPVVALGGASKIEDFAEAVQEGGASAVAAGSMFVFYGPHRAVLITYPDKQQLSKYL
jgi:cyclase